MKLIAPALLATVLFGSSPAIFRAQTARPGAAGVGDTLQPHLGNGGYNTERYWLKMRFAPDLVGYTATTTINARATQNLSSFNLDLRGHKVAEISVNGRIAKWTRADEEIIITPAAPIANGAFFSVRVIVEGETIDTTKLKKGTFPLGLVRINNWVQAVGQPSNAHTYAAFDDHPSKKASAIVQIEAPARFNSISNGHMIQSWSKDGYTARRFENTRKIATELLQIGVGPFTVIKKPGPRGVALRYALPSDKVAEIEPQLKAVRPIIEEFQRKLGAFPLRNYGFYVTPLGGDLETQSLTLFSIREMSAEAFKKGESELTVRHEIAHEYFGNSVSPRTWSDLWLNEGHATYYEDSAWSDEINSKEDLADIRRIYENLNRLLIKHGPIAAPRRESFANPNLIPFSALVYQGGALVLYALRQEIGDADFERLERAWIRENDDGVAGTGDFIALASRVTKRDMKPFLRAWLYAEKVPPMPNHADWKAKIRTRRSAQPSG